VHVISFLANVDCLTLFSRQTVQVESDMTAIERVLEYCSLKQESPAQVLPKDRPPASWPCQGRILVDRVSMSYSTDDCASLALRNISLLIEGGEKIGIVGRTGAGKSSFIQALFRMGHLVDGQIIIDDINIEHIGLDDVRNRLSIIPQDPVLFSGTIRSNLDPFDQYSDDVIWQALEQVSRQRKHLF
jgi:ABC-type multidrug transport system fused ATPase/permease subunit